MEVAVLVTLGVLVYWVLEGVLNYIQEKVSHFSSSRLERLAQIAQLACVFMI
jgi:hypothetical protein